MIKICLWGVQEPVLIFRSKSGIEYFNQCGGCSCYPMEIEGYILPTNVRKEDSIFFDNSFWYRSYGQDQLHYKDIRPWKKYKDLCLEVEELYKPFGVTVDHDRQSIEAWLCVRSEHFGSGVITWENCD
jgi:hypothetical protein